MSSYNTDILKHLLRGIAAIVLPITTYLLTPDHPELMLLAITGTTILLRGCPICWIYALLNKLSHKHTQ